MRTTRRLTRIKQDAALQWLGFPTGSRGIIRKIDVSNMYKIGPLLYLRSALNARLMTKDNLKKLHHVSKLTPDSLIIMSSPATREHVSAPFLESVARRRSRPWGRNYVMTMQEVLEAMRLAGRDVSNYIFESVDQLLDLHAKHLEYLETQRFLNDFRHFDFPAPPCPGSDFIRPLTNTRDLLEHSREQGNCCFWYQNWVSRGLCYIYRVEFADAGGVATAEIRQSKQTDHYFVRQLRGPHNSPVAPEVALAVREHFLRRGRIDEVEDTSDDDMRFFGMDDMPM